MISTLLIHSNIYHTKMGTISPWDLPPLGIAYIAAVLEKNNYPVKIIDAHIEHLTLAQLEHEIIKINPDVIGITSNIYTAKFAVITAHFIKRKFPNRIIVMGGPYPTNAYELLLNRRICDFCVIGEGEFTFLDLIQKIDQKVSWKDIAGIAYIENGKIITTPKRPLNENLDDLPFPARHPFPSLKKYHNLRGVTRRPYAPIMTSRGCPFTCNWCTKYVHGYKFRARTPENVVAEMIDDVKKYHTKEFAILDDAFTFDVNRVKKICILIKKAKLNIVLNFYNGIRADSVSDSLLKYLTAVGINRITVGVESGNQEVVYKIGKALDLKKVKNAVVLAKKYRLVTDGFFMMGHPYDTEKTMEQTIQFAIKNNFDHAYFFVAIPFPGTKLYDIVKKEGTLFIDYALGIHSHIVEGKPIFELPTLHRDIIQKKFQESYRRFYFRPKKVIQLCLTYARFIFQFRTLEIFRWAISQVLFLFSFPKTKVIKITRT